MINPEKGDITSMWTSTSIISGIVTWFIVRYILTSFFIVNQNERAVKTRPKVGQRLRVNVERINPAVVEILRDCSY